jgi:hypothetical protein
MKLDRKRRRPRGGGQRRMKSPASARIDQRWLRLQIGIGIGCDILGELGEEKFFGTS